MTTFALVTTIASICIFAVWLAICIIKFKMQPSYSAYSPAWDKVVPMSTNTHLWSIVTFVIAFLFMPALIELGEGNPWQCLGFFAPLYLIIVAIFPLVDETPEMSEYEKARIRKNKKVHVIGALLCAVATILWVILVCKLWWIVIVALAIVVAAGLATKTLKISYVFWGEMILFISGYSAALIMA